MTTPPAPRKQGSTDSSSSSSDEGGGKTTSSSFYAYESRATTPDIDSNFQNEKISNLAEGIDTPASEEATAVGILPDEVYARTMSWWRAGIRRMIVRNVAWESRVIARMQKAVRRPWLDAYFVYTSSLGTHTFFMTVLPIFFFFGYRDIGRGLLFVLAFGVYASSFVKDLICSPRPYAPPVSRLTIGSHHLEYGFPSTHSTNSMSIAMYFFSLTYTLYTSAQISSTAFTTASSLLAFYIFSIVYGRLYTGMHSFTDCAFGVLLGSAISLSYVGFLPWIEWMVARPDWFVPAIAIPVCLLLVNRHPQPVDDCPCFEDAIAFMSVVLGELLIRWTMIRFDLDTPAFFSHSMPGHPFPSPFDIQDLSAWWSMAALKMVVGIAAIFAWRIFAKFLLHRVLPPTFRFLAKLVTLPHRRFYTPATDYKSVPPEREGLRPIPSVIDLPGMVELEVDGVGLTTSYNSRFLKAGDAKMRVGRGHGGGVRGKGEKSPGRELNIEELGGGGGGETVKHYDADVLTKVFVYCGIGVIATGVMPVLFEVVGWGGTR